MPILRFQSKVYFRSTKKIFRNIAFNIFFTYAREFITHDQIILIFNQFYGCVNNTVNNDVMTTRKITLKSKSILFEKCYFNSIEDHSNYRTLAVDISANDHLIDTKYIKILDPLKIQFPKCMK